MKVKEFKTLSEQIQILRDKGLLINDEDYATSILFKENYFFLNGYRFPLFRSTSDKRYVAGATFNELYAIFLFDRTFRNILFKYLMVVENNTKSVISYQLSMKYGYREHDYLNAKTFTGDRIKAKQINDLIKKMKRQININGKQHRATLHYINNYGYIPLWVLVKVLSFGIISEMYTILKIEDRMEIANIFGVNKDELAVYFSLLSNYRNICAHEDIVYESKTQKFIDDTVYHSKLNLPMMDGEYICGKNDVYAVIIILRQLLFKNDFRDMMNEIKLAVDKLDVALNSIPIDNVLQRMGFCKNWYDIIEMEDKNSL